MVGNKPNFNDKDTLRAFILMEEKMGRQELCARLSLGEGTVRTILDSLKEKGLIESTNKGHVFTQKGLRARKRIFSRISAPKEVKLHFYRQHRRVALVYRAARKLSTGYELRDHAVRNGAEGAIILRHEKGKGLVIDQDVGYTFEYLEDRFRLSHNDILIITFADNLRDAENSALAVAEKIGGKFL